jgi:hypothetical protein
VRGIPERYSAAERVYCPLRYIQLCESGHSLWGLNLFGFVTESEQRRTFEGAPTGRPAKPLFVTFVGNESPDK